jgi:hypothetical protein
LAMQSTLWADRLMSRLLFVPPLEPSVDEAATTRRAERAFTLSLMFSGVRCLLQYAVLPFVLPVLGIAAGAASYINLVITVLAVVSIIASLRRFWRVGYRYRWQYLGVALVTLVIFAFYIQMDLTAVTGG